MKLKASSIALLIIGFALFAFFFVLKCFHLQRCDYTSDLFCHFQLSHDWLIGKPLFYENCFGFHNKIHNYFIDPLLAPFTRVFGVYGLFVVLFSLIGGSFFLAMKLLERNGAVFSTKLLLLLFYSCPLSFFIFHNAHYGFHVEMLLVPLAMLFGVTYLNRSKWYLLWAALIVLVKEDAVIVLWACFMIIQLKSWTEKEIAARQFLRKSFGITLLCFLILVLGMLWLKYLNHWEDTRTAEIFAKLHGKSPGHIADSFLYLILQRMQLTGFVLLIICMYAGWRFALGSILASLPILAVNLLAGLIYEQDEGSGQNIFSLMWVPRLSMYWAYWFCVLVVAFTCRPRLQIIRSPLACTLSSLSFGALLFGFQLWFFRHCEVTRFDTLQSIREAYEPPFQNPVDAPLANAASVAKHLPAHYPVAPMDRVFGAFHRQDIVWADRLDKAFYKPRMILASYNAEQIPEDLTVVMKHPMFMLYQDKLYIYCEAEDTSYISKAGIRGIWTDKTIR